MSKAEYKALSNYIRNTQKLTREELISVVREVIGEITKQEVQRITKTIWFTNIVRQAVDKYTPKPTREILSAIASELSGRLILTLKEKEPE